MMLNLIWRGEKHISCLNSMLSCNFHYRYRLFCYRSLICRLEEVDPRELKHEEKLAFWINIHNALVMHVMILISRYVKFTVLTLCIALFLMPVKFNQFVVLE